MADIHLGDLDKLIAFYQHLKKFNGDLKDEFRGMRQHAQAVHEDWRDPQYDRFEKDFSDVAHGIEAYLKQSEDHERYLRDLIERVKGIVETRM